MTDKGYLITSIFTKEQLIPNSSIPAEEITIPKNSDWVDYGPVIEAGAEGSWDFFWAGITPVSIVKKEGIYYFYYVAADGYRSFDGGPRHRAIGVATSDDGIHFTKYRGNPVLEYSYYDGEEEGANSGGITLDRNSNFVLYYGAAFGPAETIRANGRVAISSDGYTFVDYGMTLNHRNPLLYGFGDEIFPVAAFLYNDNWYVYYQPNGTGASRTLGVAWGSKINHLPKSRKVLDEKSGGKPVGTWGNIIWLSPEKIAFFIQRLWWPDSFLEVRTASPATPYQLSEPVERYDIPNLKRGAIFLDREKRTWFLYYNDFDRFWDVKLAPAGDPDQTPPSVPKQLSIMTDSYEKVRLSWKTAIDLDTGVVIYNVYRNGFLIGSTKGLIFEDVDLKELTFYHYEVSAVNFHGFESQRASTKVVTLADTTPPDLVSASTHGSAEKLIVVFNELVEKTSAENIQNYIIRPDIKVQNASLNTDGKSVSLSTSAHFEGISYTLTVSNITDTAATPNKALSKNRVVYTHSPFEGLVGYWNLDMGKGFIGLDTSGYGNDGKIEGALWKEGYRNKALWFDGIDDFVYIEDQPPLTDLTEKNFTFSAWVYPEDELVGDNAYAILLRVSDNPAYSFGLSYRAEGKYRAQVITQADEFITIETEPVPPNIWHHVAMVLEVDTHWLHLYLDGQEVDGSPINYSGNLMKLNTEAGENHFSGKYYIGSIKPDLGAGKFFLQHFHGLIDEVRIYNQALNADEIKCQALRCQ